MPLSRISCRRRLTRRGGRAVTMVIGNVSAIARRVYGRGEGTNMSALVGEIELRPENGFELSLRGYHRAQVDRYVATLQMRLTTLETELASSRYREQQLAGRVERLATELEECG